MPVDVKWKGTHEGPDEIICPKDKIPTQQIPPQTFPSGEGGCRRQTDEVVPFTPLLPGAIIHYEGSGRKPQQIYQHNPNLTPVSQKLRRNMTTQEKRLWYQFLRNLSITVHRQKIFGDYIVDFYCHDAQMVIELDGSQHFEQIGRAEDVVRDAYFAELGIMVVRYSNAEVNRYFKAVCEDILNKIELRSGKRPQQRR